MAPKISKYSTALIIKYFHIKTACSLFLTARVAKIKQKSYGCSHSLLCCSAMGLQIPVVLRGGKRKNQHELSTLKCSHPVRESASSKISHNGTIGKCVMHKRSDGKRDRPLTWVPPSVVLGCCRGTQGGQTTGKGSAERPFRARAGFLMEGNGKNLKNHTVYDLSKSPVCRVKNLPPHRGSPIPDLPTFSLVQYSWHSNSYEPISHSLNSYPID